MFRRPAILILLALLIAAVGLASSGDRWAILNEAGQDVWRITSSGHLLPGVDDTYEIGSSSARAKSIYAADLVTDRLRTVPVTVTANATLSSNAAQVFIGSISGDRTYVLPTPAVGQVIDIQDIAGNVSVNGNVTIDGASTHTINGAETITLEEDFGGVRLVGTSATTWAASKRTTPDAP